MEKKLKKKIGESSGRSQSQQDPYGVRRKVQGRELAPRSLRREGIIFIDDCDEKLLKKIGLEKGE